MRDWSPDELLREVHWLRRLAHGLVADPGTADDLAADTLAAWTTARHPPLAVRGWLTTVLRHFASRHRSRERRRRLAECAVPPPPTARPTDEVLATAELHRTLVEAVLELDEPYRTTIVLRYLEDLPLAEVANRLDVPAESVRTRTRRGLERLRARLDERHGGRRAWITLLAPAATVPVLPIVSAWMTAKLLLAAAATTLVVLFLLPHDEAPPPTATTRNDIGAGSPIASQGPVAPPAAPAATERGLATSGTAASLRSATIRGRVIDEGTRVPVADAAITLRRRRDDAPAAATGRSGRDGTFTLTWSDAPREGLDDWLLALREPEHAPCGLDLGSADRSATGDVFDCGVLEMAPGTAVTGTVFDAAGAPAPGAALFLHEVSYWSSAGRLVHFATGTPCGAARDDGTFRLPDRVVPNRPAPLLVAVTPLGAGFADLDDMSRVASERRVDVRLLPSATLRVRVVDERGAPLAALVVAEPRFPPLLLPGLHAIHLESRAAFAGSFHARCDASGRVTLHPPLPGESTPYSVRCEAEGRASAVVPVTLPAADEVVVVLPVRRALEVNGVVHRRDGAPCAGATISARWGTDVRAVADDAGAFTLALERGDGPLVVTAAAPGTFPARDVSHPTATDAATTIQFTLDPAVEIAGRVLDQDERPVAGAAVYRGDDDTPITTDQEGGFVALAAPDRPTPLRVDPPQPVSSWTGAIEHVVAPSQGRVTLHLERRARFRASLDVQALGADGAPLDIRVATLERDDDFDGLSHPATATIGRLSSNGLAPGTWCLRLEANRGADVFARFAVDGTREAIDLVLQQPAGATIDGEIAFDPPLSPRPAIELAFARGPSAHFAASAGQETDDRHSRLRIPADGPPTFRIVDVDPTQRLRIVADGEGFAAEVGVQPSAGNSRVRIVLRATGTVQVRSATPFHGGFTLQFRRDGAAWGEPVRCIGFTGKTELIRLPAPAGDLAWRLRVPTSGDDDRGASPWRQGELTLAPGGTATIEIR